MSLVASIEIGDKKQSNGEMELTTKESSSDPSNHKAVMRSM